MKIYTHYSDSHKIMFEEFFKQSLHNIYSENDVSIEATYHPQTTRDGAFMSSGWLDTMDIKLDVILKAIRDNWEKPFIFSDCDIQFFKPFISVVEDKLKRVDIVCQEDRGTMCAGFFGCNCNYTTLSLFQSVKATFRSLVNDQYALNCYKDIVKYSLLDISEFYTIGNFFNNKNGTYVWDNVTNIIPPKNMLIHHANYVIGVDNKLKLMEMIRANAGLD